MILNLRALENLPARVTLTADAGQLQVEGVGFAAVGTITADFDVVPGDHAYYCHGKVVSEARLECSRCLEPFMVTLCGEIDFSVQEVVDEAAVRRDDVPDNELLVPAGVSEIDISGPVREALLLEIPLKPLCREDCRGLCPICGVDHNKETCECKVEKTDPRWDALRDLLK
jgi:uncharacterized protein